MPVTFTTELPNANGLVLDNGVEDEITATWDDTVDYGEYAVEYKETSASSWTRDAAVGQNTTSHTIGGLEDGEDYDVRLRAETEHVSSSWTSASITTVFPSPSGLTVDSSTMTSVTLVWNDNSDNEDGFRVYRRPASLSGWTRIADLAPNTTQYEDSTPAPGTTYDYRVEGYTEDATSSATVTVTLTDDGKTTVRRSSDGWTVEVDHPNGETLRPALQDDVAWLPTTNGLPRVRIPVPADERWRSKKLEGAAGRVYYDGREYPVDELEAVESKDDRTVLEARGGLELLNRVEATYTGREAHLAAEDIIAAETSYASNVDDPASSTRTDLQLQEASTEAEFEDVTSPGASDPWEATANGVETLPSVFYGKPWENDYDSTGGAFYTEKSDWNVTADGTEDYGHCFEMRNVGDSISFSFTPQYDIPSGDLGVWFRFGNPNGIDDLSGFAVYVEGVDEASVAAGYSSQDTDTPNWTLTRASASQGISAGQTVNVRVELTDNSDGSNQYVYLDMVGLHDQRFSYTWDEDALPTHSLAGPERYPEPLVPFEAAATAYNVLAGRVDGSFNDTSNGQRVSLSNDQGSNWTSEPNVVDFETSFSTTGTSLKFRARLSRFGTNDDYTPMQGRKGQTLQGYSLYADVDNTPVLYQQHYDGSVEEVLNEIAEYGNFVWEYRLGSDGAPVVEWTQPGARAASSTEDVLDFDARKTVAQKADQVVLHGSAQTAEEEEFTADHGTAVALDRSNLVPAREVVMETDGSAVYARGQDYKVDWGAGEVTTIGGANGGSMSDGAKYKINYEWRPTGKHPDDADVTASDPRVVVRDAPGAHTEGACSQAALYVYERISSPLQRGRVTVAEPDPTQTLVAERDIEGVPEGAEMVVHNVRHTPEGVELDMGTRDDLAGVLERVTTRLGTVTKRS